MNEKMLEFTIAVFFEVCLLAIVDGYLLSERLLNDN